MIPTRLNLLLATSIIASQAMLLAVLPIFLVPTDRRWAWLLVPLTLTIVPHWALIHEAAHRHLLPRRRANDRLAQLLAILFGSPFAVLAFGHLAHHALNARPVERPDVFDPARTSFAKAAPRYFLRLLGGLHLAELASSLLAWLPRCWLRPLVRKLFHEGEAQASGTAERAERQLLAPPALRAIRIDGAAAATLLATGFWLWGSHWPLFTAALLGRALLVSLLDNAPHYGGDLGDSRQGHDMRLPAPLAALILNANLHGTHHRHPHLPWTELPGRFASDRISPAGSWLVVPWRQLGGPISIGDLASRP